MKAIAIALLGLLLAGCDYTVPLATKPEMPIDRTVLGVWEHLKEGDAPERLLVLPLGETEYLVSFPAGNRDAMFARACIVKVKDEPLVQLRWFGTARGDVPGDQPEDRIVYQYVCFSVVGDILALQLLNPEVVPKSVASTEELRRAIEAGIEQPNLFREPMRFRRIKP